MALDRTTVIRGPAIVTYDSQVFYTNDDIKVVTRVNTAPRSVDMFGPVAMMREQIITEVTFTPAGKWGYYAKLWPAAVLTPVPGTSLVGATDKNLTIQTLAGQLETWNAAFISKLPEATFSATKKIWGAVTFTCIGKNNTAWSDAAKRSAVASQAFADTSFAIADEVVQEYTVAWGVASPWATILTADGVKITPSLKSSERKSDGEGVYDVLLDSVEWVAKLTPVGVSESQLMTLLKHQGSGVTRGSLISDNAQNLVISGTGVYVKMTVAVPRISNLSHSTGTDRIGEIEFVAHPAIATGARSADMVVATAAP